MAEILVPAKDGAGVTRQVRFEEVVAGELSSAVTVRQSALPAGAATEATLLLIESAVDGIEALLGGTLTVAGTVTANLAAGNNNIGDVDVASLPPVGAIDSGNSTTAALIANATFTGTGVEVLDRTSAEITVFANVASATNGLKLQTSPDNANWDHQHTYSVPAMAAGEGLCFQFTLSERYFRVVYTNGAGAQTTFRLQTRLNKAPAAPHYHAISHTLDVDHPAQTVRAVITGQTTAGGGGLVNVKVNPSGALTIDAAVSSLPGTVETDITAIKTAVEIIDNAISGAGVNVSQIGGSAARTGDLDTGAGTDTYPVMGLVYSNTGGAVIVGNNDPLPVTGSVALSGRVPDDTPLASDVFSIVGLVRDDALATLAELDGNFTYGRVDSTGALWTHLSAAIPAGTNNIGDVDVLTQPARAATTDNIGAKLATDAIMNGTTALTPKFAIIDAATSGDNTLVAAVSSKKIRVLACFMVAAGAVNARFESGAAGTALSGQMNLTTNSGFTLPFNPVGWFETAATTLLNLELSGAVSVDGSLVYVEV